MTSEEIIAMKPGRELDELVAEKVMGWKKKTFPGGGGGFTAWVNEDGKVMRYISNSTMHETCYRCEYFRPTKDIVAAWEVVDRLQQLNWNINVGTANPYSKNSGISRAVDRYYAEVYGEQTILVYAPTAPEAICKAAMLAVMDG